jgi:murein DD-endopeptidase MepM/ murein hydrolase activator NlpD
VVQLLVDQSGDDNGQHYALAGCGNNLIVDPAADFQAIPPYGGDQIRNAAVIVAVGQDRELPARGWIIAVATAMQESALRVLANPRVPDSYNYPHQGEGSDHDSVGLFQQRQTWGPTATLMDPAGSAELFYDKLERINGWETMPLYEAAQRVQISAFPHAYAKHEPKATEIVNALTGGGGRVAAVSRELGECAAPGEISASGWVAPVQAPVTSGFRTPERPTHQGVDLGAPRGTPIIAAASGTVITSECNAHSGGAPYSCDIDGSPSIAGCGWYVNILHAGDYLTRYCHFQSAPMVKEGDIVQAGQLLGYVGSSGRSSGPHLHFEVHVNADRSSAGAINPVIFMEQMGAPLGQP